MHRFHSPHPANLFGPGSPAIAAALWRPAGSSDRRTFHTEPQHPKHLCGRKIPWLDLTNVHGKVEHRMGCAVQARTYPNGATFYHSPGKSSQKDGSSNSGQNLSD